VSLSICLSSDSKRGKSGHRSASVSREDGVPQSITGRKNRSSPRIQLPRLAFLLSKSTTVGAGGRKSALEQVSKSNCRLSRVCCCRLTNSPSPNSKPRESNNTSDRLRHARGFRARPCAATGRNRDAADGVVVSWQIAKQPASFDSGRAASGIGNRRYGGQGCGEAHSRNQGVNESAVARTSVLFYPVRPRRNEINCVCAIALISARILGWWKNFIGTRSHVKADGLGSAVRLCIRYTFVSTASSRFAS